MSITIPKNISASVRQRLLNLSQASKRPFQEILQYYTMECRIFSCICHVGPHFCKLTEWQILSSQGYLAEISASVQFLFNHHYDSVKMTV